MQTLELYYVSPRRTRNVLLLVAHRTATTVALYCKPISIDIDIDCRIIMVKIFGYVTRDTQ
jgi:hypothetical protein